MDFRDNQAELFQATSVRFGFRLDTYTRKFIIIPDNNIRRNIIFDLLNDKDERITERNRLKFKYEPNQSCFILVNSFK